MIRQGARVIAIHQPHLYSRTRDQFDDFAAVLSEVDALVLTEVYPAGEAPIAGADGKSLARAIRTRGRVDPVVVNAPSDLRDVLPDQLEDARVGRQVGPRCDALGVRPLLGAGGVEGASTCGSRSSASGSRWRLPGRVAVVGGSAPVDRRPGR